MPRTKIKEEVTLTKNDIISGTAFGLNAPLTAVGQTFDYLSSLQNNGVKTVEFPSYLCKQYNLTQEQADVIIKNWKLTI